MCPYPNKTRYKCCFYGIDHTRGVGDMKVTTFEISPKFTMFWGAYWGKTGGKMGKTYPSPNKTWYKCYFEGIGQMRGGEDGQMTNFDISPKLTL